MDKGSSPSTLSTTTSVASATTPSLLLKRHDSFTNLSTVLEDDDEDVRSESLFSTTTLNASEMVEVGPAADVPPMLMPDKNPKMYQLVQMSGESSFWWDSTDSDELLAAASAKHLTPAEAASAVAAANGNFR